MYQIEGMAFEAGDPALAAALGRAYEARWRPLCGCRVPGIEMYIARIGDRHVVKRMPGTGERHAPSCGSYEPPGYLSGLGELLGGAIRTNPVDNQTTLRFDFALSRRGPAVLTEKNDSDGSGELASQSIRAESPRMTLRAMLHYLLNQAGLNRWSPAMQGKRNWRVIRKHLLMAAEDKLVKGNQLTRQLFIPEVFSLERKADIAQARQRIFDKFSGTASRTKQLLILVAEVKEFGEGKFSRNMRVKHMPDLNFVLPDTLYQRVLRNFADEIDLWNATESAHLIVAATFSISSAGIPTVEEMTLIVVDERWLVIESIHDILLVDSLVEQGRRFIKTMRYRLSRAVPLPVALLTDCPDPVAAFVVTDASSMASLLSWKSEAGSVESWHWDVTSKMPPLPRKAATIVEQKLG